MTTHQQHHQENDNFPKIQCVTPTSKLLVPSKSIVNFKNLKENCFDLSEVLLFQAWETFFEILKGPTLPDLVKQFYVMEKE